MKDPHIREILRETELLQYSVDPNSKIVEEFRLPVAGARIDIAVINGSFHGYEIKSASDTLKRLPDQLKSYELVFDYLTVVTEEKYCQKILSIVPDWVGVSICTETNDLGEVLEVKQSLPNWKKNGFYVAKLLWKEELILLLSSQGITFNKSDRAWTLCEIAANKIDTEILSKFVRDILKARYTKLQQAFH